MPRTSKVWEYFHQLNKDIVQCDICGKQLKFGNSTSNLKTHIKAKHPQYLPPEEQLTDESPLTMDDFDNFEEELAATPVLPTHRTQPDTLQRAYPNVSQSTNSETPTNSEEPLVISYQKLVVPTSMRSEYWKCFGFAADENGEIITRTKIVCLLCKRVITYNRNTSNLRLHLQNKHMADLAQLESNKPAKDEQTPGQKRRWKKREPGNIYSISSDGSFVVNTDNSVITHAHVTPSTSNNAQGAADHRYPSEVSHQRTVALKAERAPTSVKVVADEKKTPSRDQPCTLASLHPFIIPNSARHLASVILDFVVADLQLPDVVEGRGFQRLVASLRSPCEIPSRAKLIDEMIPQLYDATKEKLLDTVSAVAAKQDVSLMVEEWYSASNDVFVTFSICYQQEDSDTLVTRVLSTTHCYTVVNWSVVLDNLLDSWHIGPNRVRAVVCASHQQELIDTMTHRGLVVVPCIIHTLQEVCARVCFEQEDVREILNKCRACIYLISKNSHAMDSLRFQDTALNLDEPLCADYPRVWLTTYEMLEGLLARRNALSTVMDVAFASLRTLDPPTYDRDLVTITEADWALLEEVLAVLEPFKVTLMTLSEEKAPLVSLLKPLLWQLLSAHLKEKPEDPVNIQVFKAALKTVLAEKYTDPGVNSLLEIATALDPRFKNLPHMAAETRANLDGPVKAALTRLIEHSPPDQAHGAGHQAADEAAPSEKKKPRLLGMMMMMGDSSASMSSPRLTSHDRAALELVQYQSEPSAPLEQCPMAWWAAAKPKCPHLARMSTQYTCLLATAVPALRLEAGNLVSFYMKRANIPTDLIDKMLFLNANHSS